MIMIKFVNDLAKNIGSWVFVFFCFLEVANLRLIEVEAAKQIFNTYIFVSIGIFSGLGFFKETNNVENKVTATMSRASSKLLSSDKRVKRVARLLLLVIVNSFLFYLLMLIFQAQTRPMIDIEFILPSQLFLFLALGDLMELATENK